MPDDQQSHVPDLESFLQELYGAGWFSSEQALGLYQDDPMALISYITDPTTPTAPSSVFVLGMATEIGVAWQYFKLLGNADVTVEVRRSDNASMTNAVSLGTFQGFFMVDDNNHVKFGSSVTRYYQVRTVARSGEALYFSPYSTAMPGTTLAAGSTNADVTTRMNTFAAAVQGLHLFPLAVPSTAVDLSALSQAISVLSQKVSVLSSLPAASVTSNELSAVSAQAASALSQALSVVSATDAALSAGINGVSNALSNELSVRAAAINSVSNAVSVVSQALSVLSQATSVAQAALSVRIDTQSQAGSVLSQGLSVVSQALSVQAAALSVRIDTQSQFISAISQQVSILSQAQSVLSQAVSVADAALSVRIDTQSQSISVLSQQVSILSQKISVLSQQVSVLSATIVSTWTSFAATMTTFSGAATFGTVNARTSKLGRLVFLELDATMTSTNTGAVDVRCTNLPYNTAAGFLYMMTGKEVALTNAVLNGQASGLTLTILNATGGYPGANNARMIITGFYEADS